MMKYTTLLLIIFLQFSCKTDSPKKKMQLSPVDAINATVITPELVDSLSTNRMDIISEIRKDVGYHCGIHINQNFLYFKITIDSNGKYSNIEVPESEGVDHVVIEECIKKYFLENDLDLGIIREMPESKYGAIPREKTYTLRVF